jgi:hypothetical protein
MHVSRFPYSTLMWQHLSEGLHIAPFLFYSGLRCYLHCGHAWPMVPASGDSEDDCGDADGM